MAAPGFAAGFNFTNTLNSMNRDHSLTDYIIDLGPGAAEEGGKVVAEGTPEEIAASPESITGRFLQDLLSPGVHEQTA